MPARSDGVNAAGISGEIAELLGKTPGASLEHKKQDMVRLFFLSVMILFVSGCAATTAQDIQPTATPTVLSTRDTTEPSITTTDLSQPTPLPSASLPVSPTRQIVFQAHLDSEENTNIYTIRADGTNLTRLTNPTSNDLGPVWSPDGSHIAFTSNRQGSTDIYTMRKDGTNVVRLTQHPAGDGHPQWSPNGTQIAFLSTRNNQRALYTVNIETREIHQIIHIPDLHTDFAWSPDGSAILFRAGSPVGAYDLSGTLFIIPSVGGTPSAIGVGTVPAWSPDGTQIAFIGAKTDGSNLSLVKRDGTNLRTIEGPYHGRGIVTSLSWSSDGTQIAFSYQAASVYTHHELFTIRVDTLAVTFVEKAIGDYLANVQWSPDGALLLYTIPPGLESHSERFIIVTDLATPEATPQEIARGSNPMWAP